MKYANRMFIVLNAMHHIYIINEKRIVSTLFMGPK